ncbi:MAG: acetyl-CoA carboxylase, biotin carboxyl carrier protein [Alphaproteobacteria bacterium]|nr:acetyl-CoA carboxylase, biotin carboxyl carrier protein [Alphaproteobacteria bacterium]
MDNTIKDTIKELSELLKETGLAEIDYEKDGIRLHVVGPATEVAPAPAQTPVVISNTAKEEVVEKPKNQVLSPIVGVVYLSPSPNAPTFVKEGDSVKQGQTLCMVEAMKTFNPVVAQQAGTIKKVLVESGAPVEYNQPLFEME